MSYGALFAVLVVATILAGAVVMYIFSRGRAFPTKVLSRLTMPGSIVTVRVSARSGAWDPGKPLGPSNRIHWPGQASYRRDNQGIVHLTFRTKDGHEREFNGPVPEGLRPETLRRVQAWRRLSAIYGVFLLVGYGVAVAVSSGPIFKRLDLGFVGMVAVMLMAALGTTVLRVVWATRSLAASGAQGPASATEPKHMP